MRVETGRNHHEIGAERIEPRQDRDLEGLAKFVGAVACPQGGIDDRALRASFRGCAGAGIERHLVDRGVEHAGILPEDVLRAVAVMHVPVDDGDAFGPMRCLRVAGRDRGMVEEAEAHGALALGMVPGRAHRDEGIARLAGHHLVHRGDSSADAAQCRFDRTGRHQRVCIDLHEPGRRRGGDQRLRIG